MGVDPAPLALFGGLVLLLAAAAALLGRLAARVFLRAVRGYRDR